MERLPLSASLTIAPQRKGSPGAAPNFLISDLDLPRKGCAAQRAEPVLGLLGPPGRFPLLDLWGKGVREADPSPRLVLSPTRVGYPEPPPSLSVFGFALNDGLALSISGHQSPLNPSVQGSVSLLLILLAAYLPFL